MEGGGGEGGEGEGGEGGGGGGAVEGECGGGGYYEGGYVEGGGGAGLEDVADNVTSSWRSNDRPLSSLYTLPLSSLPPSSPTNGTVPSRRGRGRRTRE